MVVLTLFLGIANPQEWNFAVSSNMREQNVVWNCVLCGLMGAITVSSSKGFATALSQAFSGNFDMFVRADICWLTYVLVVSAVGSIIQQLKYLNEALMHFGSSLVVPVYYVVFTSITMSAGMVLFLEIVFDPLALNISLFALGVIMAFSGVWLMNSRATPETKEDPATQEDINLAKMASVDLSHITSLKAHALQVNGHAMARTRSLPLSPQPALEMTNTRHSQPQPPLPRSRSQRIPPGLTRSLSRRRGGLPRAHTVVRDEEIRALFEEMDANSDAILDAQDLRRWGAANDQSDPEQRRLADELIGYFLPASIERGSSGPGKMTYAEFEAWYRQDLEGEMRSLHRLVLAMRMHSKGRALAAVSGTPGLGLFGSLLLTSRETSAALGELASLTSASTASRAEPGDAPGAGAGSSQRNSVAKPSVALAHEPHASVPSVLRDDDRSGNATHADGGRDEGQGGPEHSSETPRGAGPTEGEGHEDPVDAGAQVQLLASIPPPALMFGQA